MTALVVPAADLVPDSHKLLDALLFSIQHGAYDLNKVVVCFDACKPEFIHWFKHHYPFIIPLVHEGNRRNFAPNSNMGLRHVHQKMKDSAIVVNQDCVLPNSKWLLQARGEGLVSPTATKVVKEPPVSVDDIESLNSAQPEEVLRSSSHKLVGFCLYLSKDLMNKVGYFDESFKASFDDDDLSARALLAGFPVEQTNLLVHHYVSRCGAYDASRLGLNLMKYRIKWSIPKEIQHADMNAWILKNHKWQEAMREN